MDSQDKSSILQWLIPTGIMMVVVVVMLVSFSIKNGEEADLAVSKTLITSAETFTERFLHNLECVGKVGEPVCAMLEREGTQDSARTAELLKIAAECARIEKVLYSDAGGTGLDQSGASANIGAEEWFVSIPETGFPYIYVEEENAIAVIRAVGEDAKGYLLLFYPMDHFADMLAQSGYDSSSFLAVVDMEGNVLGMSGSETNECVEDGNVLAAVEAADKESARDLGNRIRNGSRGSLKVKMQKYPQVLTVVPVSLYQWGMVLGVSESYTDRQAGYLRRNTKNMVVSLLVVIAVFVCIVMVINIVGKFRSNAKKKELEDKADTDLLTGLSNKLATERKIKEYMEKHSDTQSMMFLFDIDNFKKINDTMGHAFGDEVLRSLGKQIGSIFRASDIVGRIGGDEFMVFLKNIPNDEAILKEAEKVEDFFKSFQAGEYVKYKATASIGVAIFPQEGDDFETLYKAADQGLYKAKKRGKNQLAFYKDREPAEESVSEE